MARTSFDVPMSQVASGIRLQFTFRITGRRRYAARLWLAGRLVRLAAWVAGFGPSGVSIEREEV